MQLLRQYQPIPTGISIEVLIKLLIVSAAKLRYLNRFASVP